MKKIMIWLAIAGVFAIAAGVRGGWAVAQHYFESKPVRAAMR